MTKEEAIKVLEQMRQWTDYPKEALTMAIEALSKPSLPSNLDEAAHEFEDMAMSDYDDICVTENGEERPVLKYNFTDAFKAGAEWMAGQGVNSEGKVFTSAFTSYVKTPGIEKLLKDAFPEDTEVIVQIRKK